MQSRDEELALKATAEERSDLESKLKQMVREIGEIPIANSEIMPYGWRKAAKGRTVWRIIEEIVSQNLEKRAISLGFESVKPASSEVGVFDFEFKYADGEVAYVNIKSSVLGGRKNKDDISKPDGLQEFYHSHPESNLYIATFILEFIEDMKIKISECVVMPVAWIPDIYVNPSNNGNLQSSQAKYLDKAEPRTIPQFLELLDQEMQVAAEKRQRKLEK